MNDYDYKMRDISIVVGTRYFSKAAFILKGHLCAAVILYTVSIDCWKTFSNKIKRELVDSPSLVVRYTIHHSIYVCV